MGPDDNQTNNTSVPTEDEWQLINDYRRCSPRRQEAVKRFTKKLGALEWPQAKILITNVINFRRRKDD